MEVRNFSDISDRKGTNIVSISHKTLQASTLPTGNKTLLTGAVGVDTQTNTLYFADKQFGVYRY